MKQPSGTGSYRLGRRSCALSNCQTEVPDWTDAGVACSRALLYLADILAMRGATSIRKAPSTLPSKSKS